MIPIRKIPLCRHHRMTDPALAVLSSLCAIHKPRIIIEVGSFLGWGSTLTFAGFAEQVIAIDNCAVDFSKRPEIERPESHQHLLLNNLRQFTNVELLRATSFEAAAMLDVEADMIFIDAGHSETEVRADITAWLPLLKIGGIMCGDDYSDTFPGVISAVKALLPDHDHKDRIWWSA